VWRVELSHYHRVMVTLVIVVLENLTVIAAVVVVELILGTHHRDHRRPDKYPSLSTTLAQIGTHISCLQ